MFKAISDVNRSQDHNSLFCYVQVKLKACLLEIQTWIEIQMSSSERQWQRKEHCFYKLCVNKKATKAFRIRYFASTSTCLSSKSSILVNCNKLSCRAVYNLV